MSTNVSPITPLMVSAECTEVPLAWVMCGRRSLSALSRISSRLAFTVPPWSNVVCSLISVCVWVGSENKWDLWCQPEWHGQHEKQPGPYYSLSLSLSLYPSLTFYLSLYPSLSFSLSLSINISHSLSPLLSIALILFLFRYLSLSLHLSLSLSLYQPSPLYIHSLLEAWLLLKRMNSWQVVGCLSEFMTFLYGFFLSCHQDLSYGPVKMASFMLCSTSTSISHTASGLMGTAYVP